MTGAKITYPDIATLPLKIQDQGPPLKISSTPFNLITKNIPITTNRMSDLSLASDNTIAMENQDQELPLQNLEMSITIDPQMDSKEIHQIQYLEKAVVKLVEQIASTIKIGTIAVHQLTIRENRDLPLI